MKNNSIPILAFLAVLVATILLPISAGGACIALTVTGVLAILAADYGRTVEPLRVPANVIAFEIPGRKAAALGKAA
jgi:hypothetical protein